MQAHRVYRIGRNPFWLVGGATLSDDGMTAGGSLFIVNVNGRADAERFSQSDPFTQAGVRAHCDHSYTQVAEFLRWHRTPEARRCPVRDGLRQVTGGVRASVSTMRASTTTKTALKAQLMTSRIGGRRSRVTAGVGGGMAPGAASSARKAPTARSTGMRCAG